MLSSDLSFYSEYSPSLSFKMPLHIQSFSRAVPKKGIPRLRIHGEGITLSVVVNVGGVDVTPVAVDPSGMWIDTPIPRGAGIVDISVVCGDELSIIQAAIKYKSGTFDRAFRR